VILLFIESTIKYLLYPIAVALVFVSIYTLHENLKNRPINDDEKEKLQPNNLGIGFFISYFLIACVIFLVFLNLFGLTNNYLSVVFGVVVAGYLPGWALLRSLSIFQSLSKIELVVLPFVLSIPISAIISVVFLLVPNINVLFVLMIYVVVSIFLVAKIGLPLRKARLQFKIVAFPISYLILLLIAALFVLSIFAIYPDMSIVPGLDIMHHFSLLNQLLSSPISYKGTELWFNIQEASMYLLSRSSVQIFQTTTAFLSIFSIFAFYLMSKTYLKDIDSRLPAIATLFWGAFSGLGWLYFVFTGFNNLNSLGYYLNAGLNSPSPLGYFTVLSHASNYSYWDVGYGQGLILFWYRPITLGLTLLFTLLYLLRENRLSKKASIFIFTLMLLALNFVHFPESIVFILLLFVMSIVIPLKQLRLVEASIASILSMLVSLLLLLFYRNFIGLSVAAPTFDQSLILVVISVFSLFLVGYKKRPKTKFRDVVPTLIVIFGIFYVWLLLIWLTTTQTFSIANVESVWGVPWQFYPMLLGLSGLLAIPATRIIAKRYYGHPIVIFVLLLLFAILFGRLLTYVNVNFYSTGYWERRLVPIAYAAACMVAPIALMTLFKLKGKKKILSIIMVTFLVILGLTSTFLSIEFQADNAKSNSLNSDQLQVLNVLNNLPDNKVLLTLPNSYLFNTAAQFTQSSWLIDYYRYQLWTAQSPELPLNVLYSLNKPVYLLQDNNLKGLSEEYNSGYITTHILPYLSFSKSSNSSSIARLPDNTAPTSSSDTLLVLPNDPDSVAWYAYDILSQSNYNYSTALIGDIATLSQAKTLIAPTEAIASQLMQYKQLFDLKFDKLLTFNLDGYSNFSLNYFSTKTNISIDPDSAGSSYLTSNSVKSNNLILITDDSEFRISSKNADSDFIPILDGNFGGWFSSASVTGNISEPTLSLNYANEATDTATVQVNVGSGEFAYWQIGKDFQNLNATDSDFLSFYWYGKNDDKTYVIQSYSDSSNNYWFSFKDTWQGWQKVMIPLRIPDGTYDLNGIQLGKATTGEPNWDNITHIDIKNEASNSNAKGTFMINHLGFESAKTINITIKSSNLGSFELSNYNGANWTKPSALVSNGTISLPNFTLSNGLSSKVLLGERSLFKATLIQNAQSSTISIAVRLPFFSNDENLSSVQLRIKPPTSEVKVDEIIGTGQPLRLNSSIYVAQLITAENVLSYYKGQNNSVPFIIDDSSDGFENIYVNVYPLINNLTNIANNYAQFSDLLDTSGKNLLAKAKPVSVNPVQGKLGTFKNADFEGNIIMYSDSSAMIRSTNNLTNLTLKYGGLSISGVSTVLFTEKNVTLIMNNCGVNGGEGFYSYISTNELVAKSANSTLGTALLLFNNGTSRIVKITSQEAQVLGGSVSVLRQPFIQVEGKNIFYNLYTYGDLSTDLGIFGVDTSFQGKVSFKVIYGDTFTVSNNFNYDGQVTYPHNSYSYNEIGVLVQSFPILLLMCLAYVPYYLYTKRIRRIMGQKRVNPEET